MNPNLMHQMAQARRADLLREAEEYRRAGLTARPTVLIRITARIPRLPIRRHAAIQPQERSDDHAAAEISFPTAAWPTGRRQ